MNTTSSSFFKKTAFTISFGLLLVGCAQTPSAQDYIQNSSNKNDGSSTVNNTDWQSYTDDAMGVTVKFPKDWYLHAKTFSPGYLQVRTISEEDYGNAEKWDSPDFKNASYFGISLRAYRNELPIDQWYTEYFKQYPLNITDKPIQTTVAGLSAVKTVDSRGFMHYFVANGQHVLDIDYNNSLDGEKDYRQVYNQILNDLDFFTITIPEGKVQVSQENVFSESVESTIIEEKVYDRNYNYIKAAVGNIESGELVFTSPEKRRYVVSKSIEKELKSIAGIVQNPFNPEEVFISTIDADEFFRATDSEETTNIPKCQNYLYRYNLLNGDLTQFYSGESQKNVYNSETYCNSLKLLGTQGSKLIIRNSDVEESVLCLTSWYTKQQTPVFMELADIHAGFQSFTVPQDKVDAAAKEREQCIKEIQESQ